MEMKNLANLAKRFLDGLQSEGTVETIDLLLTLTEQLENKSDPTSTEIRLFSNLNDFIERLRIVEHNMRSYVKDSNVNTPANKLAQLMENTSYDGNSYYRD